jgi:hypothetical protein
MKGMLTVIGGQESYFTGKLEAYLRAKGIPLPEHSLYDGKRPEGGCINRVPPDSPGRLP